MKMSGRKIFNIVDFLLFYFSKIVGYLPVFILTLLYEISSSIPSIIGVAIRYILIRSLINDCGRNVYIARWVVIKNFSNISIGDNVSIHDNSYIDGLGGIKIKNNVSIAHNSSLVSFEHTYNTNELIKYQPLRLGEIIINNDVWIGCGCRVLSNSVIGSHVVIGANSVTKGNLLSNSIYIGTPARKIKDI